MPCRAIASTTMGGPPRSQPVEPRSFDPASRTDHRSFGCEPARGDERGRVPSSAVPFGVCCRIQCRRVSCDMVSIAVGVCFVKFRNCLVRWKNKPNQTGDKYSCKHFGSSRVALDLRLMSACGVASHPCLDGFHLSQAMQTS